MYDFVIRIQGLLGLAVIIFLAGIIVGSPTLMVVGGVFMALGDVIDMYSGVLKPVTPIIAAIILGGIIKPWYLGVFWSMAIFHVWDLPSSFMKVVMGEKVLGR